MSLLKDDSSIPEKVNDVAIVKRPKFSISDGWNFGIGFGLAMSIAIPVILLFLSCLIGIGLSIVGISLGTLLGG